MSVVVTSRMFPSQVEDELIALADKLRATGQAHPDPRAKTLCETAACVLLGLQRAFHEYEVGRSGPRARAQ